MDELKRKLELFDKQLNPKSLHKLIIETCPLVFAAVGLMIGIAVENISPLPLRLWMILPLSIAGGAFIYFFGSGNPRETFIAYSAGICFICLGAIRIYSFNQPGADDIRNFIEREPTLATIRGDIISEPYVNQNQYWEFSKFDFSDPSASFYLNVTDVETTGGWDKACGAVRVQTGGLLLDLKLGDRVQIYCWLERFKPASNPGQFDIKKYMARKRIFFAASVKSRDSIELLGNGNKGIFAKLKTILRKTAGTFLVDDMSPDEPSRGLLNALLLGYRGEIDSDIYEAFRKTGLAHFISLSGMHLGILVGIVWWICRTVGLMKRGRAITCTIVVIVFLLIVPPRAPTVRAAIITWVFCASFIFSRRPSSINSLSLAAIILLLIRPTNLFEAGWQLSFASVLGIVLFTDRINFFIHEKIFKGSWLEKSSLTKPYYQILARQGPFLLNLLCVGVSAWLGGAGILLYHFYTISPLASLWTVIVFPFVVLILTLGYVKIVLSLVLPSLAALLGVIVTGVCDIFISVVKFIASLNISEILIGKVPLMIIASYYLFILLMRLESRQYMLLKKIVTTVLFVLTAGFLIFTKYDRTFHGNLRLTALDVGHGQAIIVQLPSNTNLLFDAGSMYRSDIGRKVVIPFLHHSGIPGIDSIIISHNDSDHINGIPEIVKNGQVRHVYATDTFFDKTDQWGTAKFLRDSLLEKGITIESIAENMDIDTGVKIDFLWPRENITNITDNDKSLVTVMEFAGKKILICSDIEKDAQQKIMELYPDLKADIVVVPHHGSVSSYDPGFIDLLRPEVLIYSCDESQYERLMRSAQDKTPSLFTSNDGAITISIDQNGSLNITKYK